MAQGKKSSPPLAREKPKTGRSARLGWLWVVVQIAFFLTPFALFYFWRVAWDISLEYLGYGLMPAAFWAATLALTLRYRPPLVRRSWKLWLSAATMTAAVMGVLSFFSGTSGALRENSLGGKWGQVLGGDPLPYGALKVLGLLVLASFIVTPRFSLRAYLWGSRGLLHLSRLGLAAAFRALRRIRMPIPKDWRRQEAKAEVPQPSEGLPQEAVAEPVASSAPEKESAAPSRKSFFSFSRKIKASPQKAGKATEDTASGQPALNESLKGGALRWHLPPWSLLSEPESHRISEETLQSMARRVETTLGEHGVEVRVESIRPGPRVILFGLVPGWNKRRRDGRVEDKDPTDEGSQAEINRVKVDSILAREHDLALAFKTPDLRLEAPVPGERLVGLEIPNPNPTLVTLSSVMETPAFRKVKDEGILPLALGQGTGGEPVVVDLQDLPHLLIAGATGSGKSVCINSIISTIILTRTPDKVRMLLVDPKRVELTPFNGIPHLLIPTIVETEEVLRVLDALSGEMFRRYKLMEESKTRNIQGYNRKAASPFPYIVLIVDELADLMIASGHEAEQALVRLAQLGRATGIHLILATQRPSVNVVTGLLKANIASRIAFAVASQVDSRVILDSAGAEKLLSKGDMLYLSFSAPRPRRVQGAYVSDREIEKTVQFWKEFRGPALPPTFLEDELTHRAEAEPEGDELLEKAREVASHASHLSPSLLQRRLRIGYPRAMHLIELLEAEGLVASGAPGTSRQVLASSGGDEKEPS